jgi:hypothetical protein
MSRILKRPMFKMGGSTSEGITSGLSRRGYHAGGTDRPRTTPQEILQGYGQAPRGYNVYDFLTEWGLNMASSPPMGNVIQTAAGTAKEPYSKFVEGKGKAGQLEYAMRAQASDAARAYNLALKKMDLQEYLGELAANKKGGGYSLMKPRPLYELEVADKIKNNNNEIDRIFSGGQSKWTGSVYFDKASHAKGNVFNAAETGLLVKNTDKKTVDTVPYVVDLTKFKEGDQYNVYWDSTDEEWFTVNLNEETQKWEIDKTKSMSIGSETEDFKDSSLIEMQNFIENKKEVDENERLLDLREQSNLPEVKTTKKIELKDIIHPTSDGTATGEILDEYIVQYAKDNKIVFTSEEFKEKGGAGSGYKFMTKNFLINSLKRANQKETRKIKQEEKKIKREEKNAWKWYEKWWDRYQAGTIQTPERFKKHLDSYLIYKAEKTEKQLKN